MTNKTCTTWLAALLAVGAACGSQPKTEALPKGDAPAATGPSEPRAPVPSSAPVAEPTPAPPPPPADPEEILRYDPDDPLEDLEAADQLDALAAVKRVAVKPPSGACAIALPALRVWSTPALPAVVGLGSGFVVAGYDKKGAAERVFVAHVPRDGGARPIASLPIAKPHPNARKAPLGIAALDDNHVTLAATDGEGKLLLATLTVDRGGHGAFKEIAGGVDTRFPPAVAHVAERTLVVWTQGSTPMRAHLAVVGKKGEALAAHDITPPSMGAAAATFVVGAMPPVVVGVDARDGMSPLWRVDVSNLGEPGKAEVAVPVGMVSSPPRLSAASSGVGTYIGYTGLGSAATSAIGLVAIAPIPGSPTALVPGTSYGSLGVSAVDTPGALLFAVDVPKGTGKDPAHAIHVYVIGRDGPGKATTVEGPGGDASQAAIARDGKGLVAVAYKNTSGVYVTLLECDD